MKKLPHALTLLVLGVLWGAFSVPVASAVTVYQQFSDSSGSKGTINTDIILGSFTVSNAVDIVPGELQVVVECNYNGAPVGNFFNVYVGSTTGNINDTVTSFPMYQYKFLCGGATDFIVSTTTSLSYPAVTTYQPGITYYVWTRYSSPVYDPDDFLFVTNLSEDFYYGYLLAGGFNSQSIPILPGIPGYTDVGISTTSQQVYCNANFSTSTGLLDSLGQSISLGICNVGVFLFVPSQNALNSFAMLASTTQTKIPFSYYYNVKTILQSATSTSGNFTAMHLNLGGATGVGSTSPFGAVLNQDFQLLSTSTISTYISPSTYSLLMDLARYAIWIAVMFHLYRRIVPKHANV